jgi:hypothetical protein
LLLAVLFGRAEAMTEIMAGRAIVHTDGDFVIFPHRNADQQALESQQVVAGIRRDAKNVERVGCSAAA